MDRRGVGLLHGLADAQRVVCEAACGYLAVPWWRVRRRRAARRVLVEALEAASAARGRYFNEMFGRVLWSQLVRAPPNHHANIPHQR